MISRFAKLLILVLLTPAVLSFIAAGCATPDLRSGEEPPQILLAADIPATQPASSQPAALDRPVTGTPPGPFSNVHEIESGRAYRSAQLDGETFRYVITSNKIGAVVNLRGENSRDKWYQDEIAVCKELGVEHIDIRLSASSLPSRENLLLMYDTFRDLDARRVPVLIHCKAGADRTGMASGVWRMTIMGDTTEQAMKQVSIKYGHFRGAKPEMGRLVKMFVPNRDWITTQYSPTGDKPFDDD